MPNQSQLSYLTQTIIAHIQSSQSYVFLNALQCRYVIMRQIQMFDIVQIWNKWYGSQPLICMFDFDLNNFIWESSW